MPLVRSPLEVQLPFQIDQHVHQIRTGLEDLRICRVASLRLQSFQSVLARYQRSTLRELRKSGCRSCRCRQTRAGLRQNFALVEKTLPDKTSRLSGLGTSASANLVDRALRAVLVARDNCSVGANVDVLDRAWRIAVDLHLNGRVVTCELFGCRQSRSRAA